MARLYLRCVYKYGKDVLYTPPASPDYPSNNLFCKRALRCAISMTGRWSLSRGFSSPVYLVFLAPSCVSLSLSLTSVFCRGTPYVYQPVESVATRLVPSDGRNDQDGHLPGRKRYPSNFFFSFFCVGDWSRTLCAFAASFCGLLFDRFRVKDRLACKRYKSLTIRLCSHFFFFNIIVYDNLKLFCFLFSLSLSPLRVRLRNP